MKSTELKLVARGDPVEAAEYVATFAGELALIARRHGLDTLGYLLEMARLEAENLSRPAGRQSS
jgi:hypothetical protein